MLTDVLRTSEFWTGLIGAGLTMFRPVLHLDDATLHTIQTYAAAYIVSRVSGKIAKATIKG